MEWYFVVVIVVAVAIVLFVPMVVWMVVISGLYQVARDRMRRRALAPRKRAARLVKEVVTREEA